MERTVRGVCLLVLILQLVRAVKYYEAKCVMDVDKSVGIQKVKGTIRLRQVDGDPVVIGIKLTGLSANDSSKLHGFHIHEGGDIADKCSKVGNHFNPASKEHGGPTDTNRHAGDLGNLEEEDGGEVNVILKDSVIALWNMTGRHNVVGRTMVLHAHRDDLGKGRQTDSKTTGHAGSKIACCRIADAKASDFNEVSCKMTGIGADPSQTITGDISIKQLTTGGMTTYDVDLSGFSATDEFNEHGFHVHQTGSTANSCSDAKGHYNPNNVNHGARTNNPTARHVGDLGNVIETNNKVVTSISDVWSSLVGNHAITNRAIVVHAKADDLGLKDTEASRTTGDAGTRLGCCVISKLSKQKISGAKMNTATVHALVIGVMSAVRCSLLWCT